MNKLAPQLIICTLILGLFGCAGEVVTTPPSATPTSPPSTPLPAFLTEEITATQPWKVAFFIKDGINPETGQFDNGFFQTMWDGAAEAGRAFGLDLTVIPNECDSCVEAQIELVVDTLAADSFDGMLIVPADSIALVPVVEQVIAEYGIPVVVVDNPLASDQLLTSVSFDNYTASKLVGEWLVEQLDGAGEVVLLYGPFGQQTAGDRRAGILTGLNRGDIEILATAATDNWEREEAAAIARAWLTELPQVDAIAAANDTMALGVLEAVTEAGRDDILITGFDAIDAVVAEVEAGRIAATVDQTPDRQARLGLQLLLRHLENGEQFPEIVLLPETPLVTSGW